ncbi:MAG: YqgE/AlgH family protein [Flavobacterium sp.]|nr:YqgE/AlgH family protein [Candidatus Neoflavobacterium equi]
MNATKPKQGNLLIAKPATLGDEMFSRTVVLLADHSSKGSIGFILNKPLQFTIQDLIPEIHSELLIYNGGPVEQDSLYYIHNVPHIIKDSIEIANGVYWGGDFQTTKKLINEGVIQKENIRFFLGYSGWGIQQLEEELTEGAWLITEEELAKGIISKETTSLWKEKILEQGDLAYWSNAPEHPSYN